MNTSKIMRIAGVAALLALSPILSALDPAISTDRICAVAAQDRSRVPNMPDGSDESLVLALAAKGFQPVLLRFEPPADVEYAARQKGCSHILYTDIVEKAVEFRLFRLDTVLPLVSTTLKAKSKADRMSRASALAEAFERQATFLRNALAKGEERYMAAW